MNDFFNLLVFAKISENCIADLSRLVIVVTHKVVNSVSSYYYERVDETLKQRWLIPDFCPPPNFYEAPCLVPPHRIDAPDKHNRQIELPLCPFVSYVELDCIAQHNVSFSSHSRANTAMFIPITAGFIETPNHHVNIESSGLQNHRISHRTHAVWNAIYTSDGDATSSRSNPFLSSQLVSEDDRGETPASLVVSLPSTESEKYGVFRASRALIRSVCLNLSICYAHNRFIAAALNMSECK